MSPKWIRILGLETLTSNLRKYVDLRLSILKYELFLGLYKLLFFLIGCVLIILLLFVAFLLGSLALVEYLNEILESNYIGYLLVSIAYLVLGLGLLSTLLSPRFSKWVTRLAARSIDKENRTK